MSRWLNMASRGITIGPTRFNDGGDLLATGEGEIRQVIDGAL